MLSLTVFDVVWAHSNARLGWNLCGWFSLATKGPAALMMWLQLLLLSVLQQLGLKKKMLHCLTSSTVGNQLQHKPAPLLLKEKKNILLHKQNNPLLLEPTGMAVRSCDPQVVRYLRTIIDTYYSFKARLFRGRVCACRGGNITFEPHTG